jgi:hypothetical protein
MPSLSAIAGWRAVRHRSFRAAIFTKPLAEQLIQKILKIGIFAKIDGLGKIRVARILPTILATAASVAAG